LSSLGGVGEQDLPVVRPLFHLLASEISCYRFWGEGVWTAYGPELARRTTEIVAHDL
jgi:hypothetical protein